ARDLQRALAVLDLAHLEAARGQGEGHHLAHRSRIVDDQQLLAHAVAPGAFAERGASPSTPRLAASASWRAASASAGEGWTMVVLRPRAARSRTNACSSCSPAACTRST